MILARTVAREVRFVLPAPVAPFADQLQDEQANNGSGSKSQQVRIGVSEPGFNENKHSPVFLETTV
jgi:hypothetical protein